MRITTLVLSATALLAAGCASHQLRFEPWKGLPQEAAADTQNGVFHVSKEKLIDAVAATLEHEPYLHWTFESLDKANGLVVGSAGLYREVQVRVTNVGETPGAETGASPTASNRSQMAVSIPRRALKTQAKIYVLRSDPSHRTAYEPEASQLDKYDVVAADAELDPAYFYSFTYRVLNDRTQVPFRLTAYEDAEALGQPPAHTITPEPMPAATPVVDRSEVPIPTPQATPMSDATKAARPE